MKLHKDFYEYKTIPFTYFAKIKNRHDFKGSGWLLDVKKILWNNNPERRDKEVEKNVWQHNTLGISIFINRTCYRLLLTQEG